MKSRESTLVILSPGFPKNEADSVCMPAQQLFIQELKRDFPKLKIIVLTFEYPLTVAAYSWYHLPVFPFNTWKKGRLSKLFIWSRIWKKLRQIKKENRVVGLLSFWCTECALIGRYFAKFHGLKHYCWILGQDARKANRLISLIRPRPSELIAMSDFLVQEFFKNHHIKPAHVIPNGVNKSQFSRPAEKRDIDILGVGSLIPLKQFDVFIRLFGELTAVQPLLNARIYGKGPEKENLQSLIVGLGLKNKIRLEGEIGHEGVLELMQRSRVLLHTSSYEGFSTVCLEAIYAGAQVISFCKPMKDSIRHWHIATSSEEMLRILKNILQNPGIDYQPVLAYDMRDSAIAIINLFNYKEPREE